MEYRYKLSYSVLIKKTFFPAIKICRKKGFRPTNSGSIGLILFVQVLYATMLIWLLSKFLKIVYLHKR